MPDIIPTPQLLAWLVKVAICSISTPAIFMLMQQMAADNLSAAVPEIIAGIDLIVPQSSPIAVSDLATSS